MSEATMDAVFVIFLFIAIICGAIAIMGFLTETLPVIIQRYRRRRNGHTKRSGRYRSGLAINDSDTRPTAGPIEHVLHSSKGDTSV